MVDIFPFKGILYDKRLSAKIENLVSPPYDIVPPELKKNLKGLSEYNIVNLILPDPLGDINDIYESARIRFEKWIKEKVMVEDEKECLYLVEESFDSGGKTKKMIGLIAITKIEEYETGKILRHEKTLSKPKEDRLSLLKACRTNFGLIYLLYDDKGSKIQSIIDSYISKRPELDFVPYYDKSLAFRLWKISSEKDIATIQGLMKSEIPLIADGHHRYETSRIYKHMMETDGSSPEDYILTFYVSSNSRDIAIHPTHRAIDFKKDIDLEKIQKKASGYFDIKRLDFSKYPDLENILDSLANHGRKSLAVYSRGQLFLFSLKLPVQEIYGNKKDTDIEYESLDVNILHKILLEKSLDGYDIDDIKYVHTLSELKDEIDSNGHSFGFILNPSSIKTVKDLAVRGQVMPQKSTYFYPKPCTGLVLYRFG